MSNNRELTRMAFTGTIHPELLKRLTAALQPAPFNAESTLYHMGYAQAQADFCYILNHHLQT